MYSPCKRSMSCSMVIRRALRNACCCLSCMGSGDGALGKARFLAVKEELMWPLVRAEAYAGGAGERSKALIGEPGDGTEDIDREARMWRLGVDIA